jgi:hypothetical protein
MPGEGEIVGDVVNAALTARAVEPAHGEAAHRETGDDGRTHEAACLNCHACGQAAHVHRTLGGFFHDLVHGVFHFEGKIWHTLPLLAWNPGKLTREYIDGRRARYVSPIALFLFSVFLMFAVVKQFSGEFDPGNIVKVNGTRVNESLPAQTRHLAALKAQRAELVRDNQPTYAIDGQISGAEEALKVMQEVKDARFENLEASSEIPAVDRTLKALRTNPGLVLYKLQNNAYKFSWALIPLSVPLVWLLFAFSRRFLLYDHTVFVTYSLCFMTLLVVVLTLAVAAGVPLVATAAALIPPWHMYRQLRGTYGLSVKAALWRTAALLVIALVTMILFTMLILAETGG